MHSPARDRSHKREIPHTCPLADITYQASSVTPDQFRTDDPSGVTLEPATTTIGGVPAKSFTGYNDPMGTTSEVWFIHGGFLFEVTTYQQSAKWLADVLRSWRFI